MSAFFKDNHKKILRRKILIIGIAFILLILTIGVGGIYFNNKKFSSSNELRKSELSDEDKNCPYLNEVALNKTCQVPQKYIVKLWKKGYHWSDIGKFWDWKIEEKDIPNRKLEKRIGIIKSLGVLISSSRGTCSDLVVILRKISNDGLKINIDGSITDPSGGDNSKSTLSTRNYIKKLVNFFLKQENIDPQKLEITIALPRGSENTGKEKETGHATLGKSFGSAIYLALLSAYHQKPISNKVAATGWLTTKKKQGMVINQMIGDFNNQEKFLEPGTNLAIAGLRAKAEAANKKGVNQLVLSKYNCSPNNNLLIKKRTIYLDF